MTNNFLLEVDNKAAMFIPFDVHRLVFSPFSAVNIVFDNGPFEGGIGRAAERQQPVASRDEDSIGFLKVRRRLKNGPSVVEGCVDFECIMSGDIDPSIMGDSAGLGVFEVSIADVSPCVVPGIISFDSRLIFPMKAADSIKITAKLYELMTDSGTIH